MKTIYKMKVGIIFLLSCCSCNNFLDETPRSQEPVDSFYRTETQLQSAVNALYTTGNGPSSLYAPLGYYDATWAFAFDNMAGMSDNPALQEPSAGYLARLVQTSTNVGTFVGGVWLSLYESIKNCNTIIAKVDLNGSAIDAITASRGIATARFFRAADYYYLVRLFGGIPLLNKPVNSLQEVYLGRGPIEEVYKFITDDLEWVLAKGNLADKPMGTNSNQISKGTVAGLLSEVYLTMAGYPLLKGGEYYAKALTAARSVINSPGGYALFDNSGGTTPFDKLRMTQYDKGSEYLYFVEYESTIRPSGYPLWSFPVTFKIADSPVQIKYSFTTLNWKPTGNLLNLYDPVNDIRRRNRQFYHNQFTFKDTKGRAQTINFDTSPFRWYDSLAIFGTGSSGKYTCVYRLADIYLIAAEAANESGADPIPYITPIVNRAYITPPAIPTGKTDRRNLILAERYRELAMEAHFWFDMLRTRLYPDADNQHKVTFSPLIGHDNGRGQRYSEKDLLLPLPPAEIQRNPNLKPQNTGY